jgi:hypothetical protein
MCWLNIDVSAERTKMMTVAVEFEQSSSPPPLSLLTEGMRKSNVLHTPLVDNVKYMDNVGMQLSYEDFNTLQRMK